MKKTRGILAVIAGFLLIVIIFESTVQLAHYIEKSSKKTIVIDPGHGGIDGGANKGSAIEKEIALNVSKKLASYIEQSGNIAIMTRDGDYDLASKDAPNRKREDLRNRLNIINDKSTDMYISIHLNSIPSEKWRGAQVFYQKGDEESKVLAEEIQNSLKEVLKNTEREYRADNRIYLLKNAENNGVLIEIGFLSNDEERQLLQNKKYQEKVAFAIYQGLTKGLEKLD